MADWWTFGIFLYEMVVGHPPFYSSNDNEMLTMIMKYNFAFPQGLQISENVQNLIRGLLIKNPDSRQGINNGAKDIINHPWFIGFDFNALLNFKLQPPFVPVITSETECSNFDPYFTTQDPSNTKELVNPPNMTKELSDWDYNKEGY